MWAELIPHTLQESERSEFFPPQKSWNQKPHASKLVPDLSLMSRPLQSPSRSDCSHVQCPAPRSPSQTQRPELVQVCPKRRKTCWAPDLLHLISVPRLSPLLTENLWSRTLAAERRMSRGGPQICPFLSLAFSCLAGFAAGTGVFF